MEDFTRSREGKTIWPERPRYRNRRRDTIAIFCNPPLEYARSVFFIGKLIQCLPIRRQGDEMPSTTTMPAEKTWRFAGCPLLLCSYNWESSANPTGINWKTTEVKHDQQPPSFFCGHCSRAGHFIPLSTDRRTLYQFPFFYYR